MGHIQDRWYRPARDPETGKILLNSRGKPIMEKTELHGKGLRYRVRYVTPDGEERSKSFADRQKARAEDFLIEVESDKREGKYIDPRATRRSFRQQAESWLKGQSPDPATREILRSRLRSQIYPYFGDERIARIEPAHLREWLDKLEQQGLSENYKLVLFTLVCAVFDSAVDDRLIRNNPCRARTVRRPGAKRTKVVVWPESQLRAIHSAISDRFAITVPLGAGLGLRQGEILGFSPDDIDREALTVHIQRQIKTVSGVKMFALPKSGKTRIVPISSGVLAEIDDHLSRYPATAVTLPWAKPDGRAVTVPLLVTGDNGRVYSGDLFTKVIWQGAFREAGVEYRKQIDGMHALRHFYASTLLARGVSIAELAEYLGHADPGFTLRTYTHLVPSSYERTRRAIDAVWSAPAA